MKRSKHSLSHYKLLTCKMGQLIPITWFEALPGDTIQHATSALIRCAPLVTPPMHPVRVRIHHFFVPNRLIWANFQNFITGGPTGSDTTAHPYHNNVGNVGVSTLLDYLGFATSGTPVNTSYSALPCRAYALIWNEYFRDQDLQTALTVSTGDGQDTTTSTTLQNVCWEKDYLTSSRPWAIKGPSVTLPLGTTAPVKGIGVTGNAAASGATGFADVSANDLTTGSPVWGGTNLQILAQSAAAAGSGNRPQIFTDLTNATAVDVNTVRHAFALQRFEEARARYGSRYTEYLRYLGVRSSDQRLQRPEYLGGGRQTIQFSEVLQTGVTTSGTQSGVGAMFGHGLAAMRSNRYRRFFEEHGIVMSLLSVVPKTMYSQRVKRALLRGVVGAGGVPAGLNGTKEDYWQKELEHIGQQGVSGLEADVQAGFSSVFGYQDRYDEYRREESSVAGLFRSTLDTWHFSREFGGAPALNSTFVSCVPATRTFADTSNDNLYVMANHNIQARRMVSREGNSLTF